MALLQLLALFCCCLASLASAVLGATATLAGTDIAAGINPVALQQMQDHTELACRVMRHSYDVQGLPCAEAADIVRDHWSKLDKTSPCVASLGDLGVEIVQGCNAVVTTDYRPQRVRIICNGATDTACENATHG